VLTPDIGARALFEHFFRRVAGRLSPGRESGAPPWEIFQGRSGITSMDLRQLRDWYADACAGRQVPLRRLHNLLLKIDRQLAA